MGVLDRATQQHCLEHGYTIEGWCLAQDGYRVVVLRVPDQEGTVRLAYNGEVFLLSFPGGYDWADFAYQDEEREDVLEEQLRFLDVYATPPTVEATVKRRFRRDRRELRLSNGAVLRNRGWSRGPEGM